VNTTRKNESRRVHVDVAATSSNSAVTQYGTVDVEGAVRLFDAYDWCKTHERTANASSDKKHVAPCMTFQANSASIIARVKTIECSNAIFDIFACLPCRTKLFGVFPRKISYSLSCVTSHHVAESIRVLGDESLEGKHSYFTAAAQDSSGLLRYGFILGFESLKSDFEDELIPFVYADYANGKGVCYVIISNSTENAVELAEQYVYRWHRRLRNYAIVSEGKNASGERCLFVEAGVYAGQEARFAFHRIEDFQKRQIVGESEILETRPSLLVGGNRNRRQIVAHHKGVAMLFQ
jgi:hypothetical protein